MASIRHYSGLRFAQLAVFSGLNTALIYIVFQQGTANNDAASKTIASFAGLAFSIIFFWMEVIHDLYKKSFIELAEELSPNGHWARRPKMLAILIRIPVWSTYIIPFVFWVYILIKTIK